MIRPTLFLLMLIPGFAAASLIPPDAFVHVSLAGDRNAVGALDAGSLSTSPFFIRERADLAQETLRIALFTHFDLSSLTPADVAQPGFQATIDVPLSVRLNTSNALQVNVGRVEAANTWDDSLTAGTVPLFEWAATSLDQQILVPNVQTPTIGSTFSADVSTIISDIVTGAQPDNGLVIFGATPQFQGAGFDTLALNVTIPEPGSGALFLLGLGLMGVLRRPNK